jgi:hypothetical protein
MTIYHSPKEPGTYFSEEAFIKQTALNHVNNTLRTIFFLLFSQQCNQGFRSSWMRRRVAAPVVTGVSSTNTKEVPHRRKVTSGRLHALVGYRGIIEICRTDRVRKELLRQTRKKEMSYIQKKKEGYLCWSHLAQILPSKTHY